MVKFTQQGQSFSGLGIYKQENKKAKRLKRGFFYIIIIVLSEQNGL